MYAPPNQYISQSASTKRLLMVWIAVTAGSSAVVALIVAAPISLATGWPSLAQLIYRTFSYLCHQTPERSFFLAGHHFAVCSRCTGIYAGFAAATLFYPLIRPLRQLETPARKWLFLAAIPLLIDFSLTFLGIWNNTHFSRFATGALLGAVAVLYVMPGLLELSLRQWGRKRELATLPASNTRSPVEIFSSGTKTAPSDYSAPHRRI
jgi:uncharacterized membrane protein